MDGNHAEDLRFVLGRLDGKVDMVLAGQARTNEEVKDLGARIDKVERELVAIKAERGTERRWSAGIWTVLTSAVALVVSTVAAVAGFLAPN
jgi:hypothetical protein